MEEGTVTLTEQLSHFSELGAIPNNPVPTNPFNKHRMSSEHVQVRIKNKLYVINSI